MAHNSIPSALKDNRVYRFGLFELESGARRLLRQGTETHIQDQPLELLLALVERPGEIVARQELKDRLWPGGTFVDFDKSLGVALTKLRDVLGDDSDNPRFIETVPRRGYRFIAPVQSNGAARTRDAEPGGAAPGKDNTAGTRLSATWITAIAGALVAAIGLGGWFWWHKASAGFTGRASIVVGDFANSTGNAVFDGSLRRAAIVGLEQSPFLNIVPDDLQGRLLQGLGRPPDDKLTPALARQVCQRGGAAATIYGGIQQAGGAFLLSLETDRCDNGNTVARETESAADEKEVLPKLSAMLDQMRRKLGESRESLAKYDVPVEQATTNSLEALKAYQLGLELRAQSRNVEARPAFQTAISLDPNFAIAYAQLGSSYSNLGNTKDAKVYFRKAFELRARATEPERFYITGRYFDIVTGETERGAETAKLWAEAYPDQWGGFNGVANDAYLMGRFETAVAAARQAIRLAPNKNFGYENLLAGLIALNRIDEAKALCAQLQSKGHDDAFIHLDLVAVAVLAHDEAALKKEMDWAAAHPGAVDLVYTRAQLAGVLGKLKEATKLFEQVAEDDIRDNDAESAANSLSVAAETNSEMGMDATAERLSAQATKLGENPIVLGLGALVSLRAHNGARAEALFRQMDHDYPIATFSIGVWEPMIRTLQSAGAGNSTPEQIRTLMEPTQAYEYGFEADMLPIYVRGTAFLGAHDAADAAKEFQKILDHRFVDAGSDLYPLSLLGLARAEAAQGEKAKSRAAYEELLTLWKDADGDLPPLIQARWEYQKLN